LGSPSLSILNLNGVDNIDLLIMRQEIYEFKVQNKYGLTGTVILGFRELIDNPRFLKIICIGVHGNLANFLYGVYFKAFFAWLSFVQTY